MLRELFEFCQSVLSRDRIRVSPSEGRLLRLAPPCVLTIGSETVRIVSRTVSETVDGPMIRYECETGYGPGELTVRLANDLRSDVRWQNEKSCQAIAEQDVVVFGQTAYEPDLLVSITAAPS